jgi:hypothetical protein
MLRLRVIRVVSDVSIITIIGCIFMLLGLFTVIRVSFGASLTYGLQSLCLVVPPT